MINMLKIKNKRGEDDTFKNIIIGFILFTLVGFLVFSSVIDVGDTYSKDTSQVVGGSEALAKFNDSISSVEENAKAMKISFEERSIWSAIAGVVVEGIFGIGKDMIEMILTPFDILSDLLSDVLHIPTYVTSVMLGILIIVLILALWRLLKIG